MSALVVHNFSSLAVVKQNSIIFKTSTNRLNNGLDLLKSKIIDAIKTDGIF